MSRSLDLTHVNEMFKSDKEVNLPPDALERELLKREAMAKKKAQEQTLEKKIKSLEQIEKKTEKLLQKAKKTKPKQSRSNAKATPRQSRNQHFLKVASRIEFLTQKGIPKVVTRYIQKNAFQEDGNWIAVLDTDQLKEESGKPAKQISNAIDRLKAQGWFEIIESKRYGVRLIKINPEHYNLLQ